MYHTSAAQSSAQDYAVRIQGLALLNNVQTITSTIYNQYFKEDNYFNLLKNGWQELIFLNSFP